MNRRWHAAGAVAVCLLGGLLIWGIVHGSSSVSDHIQRTYTKVSWDGTTRSGEFSSAESVSVTADQIAKKHKPASRLVDAGGVFLRYSNAIVAIKPDGNGGSRIFLDDEERGYRRHYHHVGGYWGTYSGPGETFRGGGPGAGK